MKRDKKMLP